MQTSARGSATHVDRKPNIIFLVILMSVACFCLGVGAGSMEERRSSRPEVVQIFEEWCDFKNGQIQKMPDGPVVCIGNSQILGAQPR